MTRIAIVGAGAIGSALGGLLRRAGRDILLVGRQAHVAVIRTSGLAVDGVMGSFAIHIDAAERLAERPDLAFLCVKTQDVRAAVEANREWLSGVPVVTFQNGVRADDLVAGFLPRESIVSAVVNFHASYLAPGRVTVLYKGPLMIGRPFAANDAFVEELACILRDGFPTTVTANIRGAHWLKLIVNLNNALPALTRLSLREVLHDRRLRRIAVLAMREGLAVADRAGIPLTSLPDMPASLAWWMRRLPLPLAGRLAAARVTRMETKWPLIGSTLQSLLRGEPTEIDYLNGEVVRLGAEIGVATPVNASLVRLVHEVERTGVFLSPESLLGSPAGHWA